MSKCQIRCEFCSIPDLKTTEYFKSIHGDLPHTLNISGLPSGFTVLQDLVPLAEQGCHLLLIPNEHFISLATIEDQKALARARDTILFELRIYFPNHPLFFFEHGAGFIGTEPISCGGCHVDHAHGHILLLPPRTQFASIQGKLEIALAASGWINPASKAVVLDHVFTNIGQVAGANPYIHIAMMLPDNTRFSYAFIQKTKDFLVPSQLLRMVISDAVYSRSDPAYWHWRDIHMGLSTPERIEKVKKDVLLFRKITGF